MKKLRLFVALDLPAPARAALAAFRTAAADPAVWRPLPDEALHLTLAFLGHRPEADVEDRGRVARARRCTRRGWRSAARSALPPKRPRVLTAAIATPTARCGRCSGRSATGWRRGGSTRRRRGRSGRTRPWRGCGPTRKARRGELPDPEPLEFRGEAVTLYRSQLRREGARYEPLASFRCRTRVSAER